MYFLILKIDSSILTTGIIHFIIAGIKIRRYEIKHVLDRWNDETGVDYRSSGYVKYLSKPWRIRHRREREMRSRVV